ncbi:MAG: S1/P1 nuclease, partial [Muribaculaceae bacterium]|nr:S1/P1 nuclease [Muribaculaceae bacterium]
MQQKVSTLIAIITLTWTAAFGWGKVGHDATAYIAECNLTPTAKANIEQYLGGKSIVYYASWMDKVRYTPEYEHTGRAHTFTVDTDKKYMPLEHGDAVSMINEQIELLKNRSELTDSAVAVGIKLLVHFVGDMHCPSHVRYQDRTQNVSFKLFGNTYKFHPFWDGTSLEGNHRWYYTDYQYHLDRCSDEERTAI